MKILMLSSDIDKGGIGSVVMTLYRSLIKEGINCDLTYYEGNEPSDQLINEIKENGSNLFELQSFKSAGFFGYIKQINKICKLNKYDVVHIHTSLLIWVGGLGAKIAGVKKIVGHAHGAKFLNYSQKILFFLEPIGRFMNRLICTDFVSCSEVSANYNFGRSAVFIPNYIPMDKIIVISKLEIQSLRNQLGFGDNDIIFGYIGCLDGVKKSEFIVDIIGDLRKLGVNAVAFLAGNTQYENKFINLIKKKGLEGKIKLLGFRNDCNELMQVMDYYLTASESEGMSVSLVQAQMLGKPCITSSLLPNENDLKIDLTLRIDGYDSFEWASKIKNKIDNGFRKIDHKEVDKKIYNSEFSEIVAISKLIDIYSFKTNRKKI